jgi:hypothetical protein
VLSGKISPPKGKLMLNKEREKSKASDLVFYAMEIKI